MLKPLKKIKEKKEVKGTAEQIQYADCILAALEKWEKMTDPEKDTGLLAHERSGRDLSAVVGFLEGH